MSEKQYLTDIEIAHAAKMQPIGEIAKKRGSAKNTLNRTEI